jgi:hypothetical protein
VYRWIVLVHVASVFGFLLAHGVTVFVSFRLRDEREREHLRALLDLSAGSASWSNGSLSVVLLSGVIAGFAGGWWRHGWIWVSLGIFLAIAGLMTARGTAYFRELRSAVGFPYKVPWQAPKADPALEAADDATLDRLRHSARPFELLALGLGGLLLILWLMILKPF